MLNKIKTLIEQVEAEGAWDKKALQQAIEKFGFSPNEAGNVLYLYCDAFVDKEGESEEEYNELIKKLSSQQKKEMESIIADYIDSE